MGHRERCRREGRRAEARGRRGDARDDRERRRVHAVGRRVGAGHACWWCSGDEGASPASRIVAAHAALGFGALASELTARHSSVTASVASIPADASRVDGATPGSSAQHWTARLSRRLRARGRRDPARRAVSGTEAPRAPAASSSASSCSTTASRRSMSESRSTPSCAASRHLPGRQLPKLKDLSLRWAASTRILTIAHGRQRPHGYVRAAATRRVRSRRGPVIVALDPRRSPDKLDVPRSRRAPTSTSTTACSIGSATRSAPTRSRPRIARDQIDDVLVTTFAPPPPFELPVASTLQFTYCDGPIEIAEGAYGALPFARRVHRATPGSAPPQFAIGAPAPPPRRRSRSISISTRSTRCSTSCGAPAGSIARLAEVGLDRRSTPTRRSPSTSTFGISPRDARARRPS